MSSDSQPLRIEPPPERIDPELAPLLGEPFARAWAADSRADAGLAAARPLKGKLLGRLAASRAASAPMVTSRLKRLAALTLAPGVTSCLLYTAAPGRPQRPGEPLLARRIEMQPGSEWAGPQDGHHREWLILDGEVQIGDVPLRLRDYHCQPAGSPGPRLVAGARGARLFLRESALPAAAGDAPLTVRDRDAGWPDFAPGIRRRVLWERDGQAALLYHADPGAAVPQHRHGHDEECLMVQGELFLDDLLLQEGDYQIAPAGTGHRITETDTGVVIYAHGDAQLQFTG